MAATRSYTTLLSGLVRFTEGHVSKKKKDLLKNTYLAAMRMQSCDPEQPDPCPQRASFMSTTSSFLLEQTRQIRAVLAAGARRQPETENRA